LRKRQTVFADEEGLDWEDLDHSEHEQWFKRLDVSAIGRIYLIGLHVEEIP
jgi:hypothetical protein